jgi:hypothetical protein
MKKRLGRFYNLDECKERDLLFSYLNKLQDNSKIEWEEIEEEIISIEDTGLLIKETKELIQFLEDIDVIEDIEYTESHSDNDGDGENEDFDF